MSDEQRQAMHDVRVKQAVRKLNEIATKNGGLINGNFTAVAHKYGIKVKELRNAYEANQQH